MTLICCAQSRLRIFINRKSIVQLDLRLVWMQELLPSDSRDCESIISPAFWSMRSGIKGISTPFIIIRLNTVGWVVSPIDLIRVSTIFYVWDTIPLKGRLRRTFRNGAWNRCGVFRKGGYGARNDCLKADDIEVCASNQTQGSSFLLP